MSCFLEVKNLRMSSSEKSFGDPFWTRLLGKGLLASWPAEGSMGPTIMPFAMDPPLCGWAPNARPEWAALGKAALGCNDPCGKEIKSLFGEGLLVLLQLGVSFVVQGKWIWLESTKMQVRSLVSLSGSGSGIDMSCDVGCRCAWDLMLLWLRYRLAAIAPIQSLAWESPYAAGAALKSEKKKKKEKEKEKERN